MSRLLRVRAMDVMDVMDVIDLWMAKAQIERLISANESSPTTEF